MEEIAVHSHQGPECEQYGRHFADDTLNAC